MTKEPDRFDKTVSTMIQSLRLLIAKGTPDRREERQRLLNELISINDEFEQTDPEGKTKEQVQEILKRMPDILARYELVINKIRSYTIRFRAELLGLNFDTSPNTLSLQEKGIAMTKEFQTVDGKKVSFTPKSLGVRNMRSLLECIEGLKTVEHKSEVFVLIEKGLGLCIDNYDAEAIDVDMQTAMGIMADTLSFNVVKADERKKSE